jgi:L-seryl-tRNA(Ser) seleniumtransferase
VSENRNLRELPAVHEVAERVSAPGFPRQLVVAEVRRVLDEIRREIRAGGANGTTQPAIEARVERALRTLAAPSLRRVINATGVVLHTNLGRAPLGPLSIHPGYSNL